MAMRTRPATMTADELGVHLLLNRATLAERSIAFHDYAIATGELCPECDSEDCEDNGADRHSDLTFRCCDCGHQWDAADCTVTVPVRAHREATVFEENRRKVDAMVERMPKPIRDLF